mmetsp:Transcript_8905/g.32626  ORF Transcript_8905/g.32626 Transcript_8905/m.32626 type:complete len:299 (+) Transcript_8905:2765-3661(+)
MLGDASTSVAFPRSSTFPRTFPNTLRAAHSAGAGPAPNSSIVFGLNPGARIASSSNALWCAPNVIGRRVTAYAAASSGPYASAASGGAAGFFFFPFSVLATSRPPTPSLSLLSLRTGSRAPHSTPSPSSNSSLDSSAFAPDGDSPAVCDLFFIHALTLLSSASTEGFKPRDIVFSSSRRVRPFCLICLCVAPVSLTATRIARSKRSGNSITPLFLADRACTAAIRSSLSVSESRPTASSHAFMAAGSSGDVVSLTSSSPRVDALTSSSPRVVASSLASPPAEELSGRTRVAAFASSPI